MLYHLKVLDYFGRLLGFCLKIINTKENLMFFHEENEVVCILYGTNINTNKIK